MPTDKDFRRLADAVRLRRIQLGLSQEEIKARGGPSAATLRKIEAGQPLLYRIGTTWPLERVLGWRAGSIEALLERGATPPELGADQGHASRGDADAAVAAASDAELLSELLQRALRRETSRALPSRTAAEPVPLQDRKPASDQTADSYDVQIAADDSRFDRDVGE